MRVLSLAYAHGVSRRPEHPDKVGMRFDIVPGVGELFTGQGSNSASHCAATYLDAILVHGDRLFDAAWMDATFARYWEYARHVTEWTSALLLPPPPHVLQILGTAGQNPAVARRFVNGFADPADFRHWFMDPVLWEKYLAEV